MSGTLKAISDSEKKILKSRFNIQNFVYVPTVFAESKLKLLCSQDIIISRGNTFFSDLTTEIQNRFRLPKANCNRPVMVFFKSEKDLLKYWESPEFEEYKRDCLIFTETLTLKERENLIKRAARKNTISLLTKSYGRGCDVVVYDEEVTQQEKGGVHVIQTFLSSSEVEEIQIKGRTARQGDPGSFSFVLSLEILQSLGLSSEIDSMQVYNDWKCKRDKLLEQNYSNINMKIDSVFEKHQKSIALLSLLREGKDKEKASEFLLDLN